MLKTDLTHSELFKSLVDIKIGTDYLDFHNDYYCTKVSYLGRIVRICFDSSNPDRLYKKVVIKFKEAELIKMSLPLQQGSLDKITLDTFYRGRFEIDGNLKEYSETGKGYYYISFDEDYFIELFSSEVAILV
ncbi:MAG: hypothetical protein H7289_01405 [Mucilaginibacter sp.]|nr:hypothetical protein [Mucilaginibacter sp.]